MTLLRAEAKAALWRWRETITGVAVAALGLHWVVNLWGILNWMGYPVLLIGIALTVMGVQRARFRTEDTAPGVVQIDEGRISYFGPLSGGIADLADLRSLAIDPGSKPPHWVLSRRGEPDLHIPLGAAGADALFDAFAALPGIRTEHMLRQMQAGGTERIMIWHRADMPRPSARLH
ncbi:hypothetical protein [Primorskyibacter flagellatus]|uniref:Uncharacterized protein n=1 Tax=Primorskyibacter flagellatus TaxID=1387277 RepID=A0A1W1ZUN8_9RHOB|nr:hypothetical protein [Primorskyibacter flagellatus]SMC51952.1 hypothetical protein SAMN06295998_102160 [Primorskyibacter flagellatus]